MAVAETSLAEKPAAPALAIVKDADAPEIRANETAAPVVVKTPAAATSTPKVERVVPFAREDRVFYATHHRWLAVIWLGLWIGLAAIAGAFAAYGGAAAATMPEVGVALGVGVAAYLFITAIAELKLGYALERKLNEIRKIARIGCERMRVDNETLVRGAVRDVLTEWMHIHFFNRHLRESSGWFIAFLVAQAALAWALIAAAWSYAPADPMAAAALFGGAGLLVLIHLVRHIALAEKRSANDALPQDLDPTDALASRMIDLIEEVKVLRRRRD